MQFTSTSLIKIIVNLINYNSVLDFEDFYFFFNTE